ncbi:methionine gamma-lyase [Klebsormidium nitens]|uniref:Methionine gamma-lyase n=1 Tax=Klebsormidium nitens TaxID=105231 RepID=A0A1Y1HT66_KLENI|nr:methionine gamma-lyase [Klebsormidium nitens]|eukprot:GAQ79737.1 methionine gamma-lyase [Klebsormidium nitens]
MDLFTPLSGLAGELCRPRTVGGAAGPADGGSDAEGEREVGIKRKGSYNPVKSKRAKEVSEGNESQPIYLPEGLEAVLDGVHQNGESDFDPVQALASTRHEFGEHGGVNMSVENSTTFTVMKPETMEKIFKGQLGPENGGTDGFYLYSRHFNPTVMVFSRQMAAMEGTESAYCTASGMAAIACSVLQAVKTGEHVVASNRLYGGTFALFHDLLPRMAGIHTTFVDIVDTGKVREALHSTGAKVLFLETMSNPTLVVPDLPVLAAMAHERGAKVIVDNTFAPLVVSPARFGADVVIHSLTKFISGGSDVIAGVVCSSAAFIQELMDLHMGTLMLLGATMNPAVASQLSGRLPHLALRMREHCHRAQVFAERLADLGMRVVYPGLKSHSQHEILARLRNRGYGWGGLLGLDLGSLDAANKLLDYLQNNSQFGLMAVSLGYHDTLMSCSGGSTSSEIPPDAQEEAGLSPGYVRVSVGFTGALEQRWEQLHKALLDLKLIPGQ